MGLPGAKKAHVKSFICFHASERGETEGAFFWGDNDPRSLMDHGASKELMNQSRSVGHVTCFSKTQI